MQFLKTIVESCVSRSIMATNSSSLLFTNSTANFTGNTGEHGEVISLYSMSVLTFASDVHIMFSSNRAQIGGAIFVDDSTYIRNYTLQVSTITKVGPSVLIKFVNNTAIIGGNNIYGGWLDWTINKGRMICNTSRVFDFLIMTLELLLIRFEYVHIQTDIQIII